QKELRDVWQKKVAEYEAELKKIKATAEAEKTTARQHEEASNDKLKQSHAAHDRGTRFDLGELGLQMGVVLCSLAILTKKRGFWYLGLLSAAAGLGVALTGVFGLFLGGGHH